MHPYCCGACLFHASSSTSMSFSGSIFFNFNIQLANSVCRPIVCVSASILLSRQPNRLHFQLFRTSCSDIPCLLSCTCFCVYVFIPCVCVDLFVSTFVVGCVLGRMHSRAQYVLGRSAIVCISLHKFLALHTADICMHTPVMLKSRYARTSRAYHVGVHVMCSMFSNAACFS